MSKVFSYTNILSKRLFLQFIGKVNHSAVWAFVNEKDKKVYIAASKLPITAASGVVSGLYTTHKPRIKEMKKHRHKLAFKILEHCKTLSFSKWEWMDRYQKMGYSLYNTETVPLYRTEIAMNTKTKTMDVQVITKGKRVYYIKSFLSLQEAEEYVSNTSVFTMLRQK